MIILDVGVGVDTTGRAGRVLWRVRVREGGLGRGKEGGSAREGSAWAHPRSVPDGGALVPAGWVKGEDGGEGEKVGEGETMVLSRSHARACTVLRRRREMR